MPYFDDGGNGILDVARQIKERIKAFSYAYRMTNDTKWSDRAYLEMLNAGSDSWGPSTDKWNSNHFLDTAELSAAYGIGYDWLYDSLNDTQKAYIRDTMIQWGLEPGRQVFEDNASFGWWSAATIKGNWVSEAYSCFGYHALMQSRIVSATVVLHWVLSLSWETTMERLLRFSVTPLGMPSRRVC